MAPNTIFCPICFKYAGSRYLTSDLAFFEKFERVSCTYVTYRRLLVLRGGGGRKRKRRRRRRSRERERDIVSELFFL